MNSKKELSGPLLMEGEHELRTALMKIAEEDEGPFYRWVWKQKICLIPCPTI